MLFNSFNFLLFLPIVLLVYFAVPVKCKQLWLLLASYFFYMCWNAKYLVLILLSTLVTYGCGLLVEKIRQSGADDAQTAVRAKLVLAAGLLINLGILFFFKYFNFLFGNIAKALALAHIELHVPVVDLLLPVGISFYTFQALGYLIDVYRKDIAAEHDLITYALFVSFFPQLVAGPIERSSRLLGQLSVPHRFKYENFLEGFLLMQWGYFLKIVIADRIAPFVESAYEHPNSFPGLFTVIATILFAFQIYCDFYGYSVIAKGSAKILDIDLMENFDVPYLSLSVAEFWRRWHISLTSWFRDYVYIPLGGNRKGRVRKYANILIVFLLSGLWHGAGLSFVVWGGLNGLYQVIGEILKPARRALLAALHVKEGRLLNVARGVITFLMVDFAWLFFRASGMRNSLELIRSMLHARNFSIFADGSIFTCGLDKGNFFLLLFCLCVLFAADICKKRGIVLRSVIMERAAWQRILLISFSVLFILLFGKYGPAYDAAGFIYFQF